MFTLGDRRLHCDLIGAEAGRTVCFAHALAADSGMWAEQVPAALALGCRVLRIDMRGHGSSDPLAGDYTLQSLASDAQVIWRIDYVGLSIGGMIGGGARNSLPIGRVLADAETPPASLKNAGEIWEPRFAAVRKHHSLEPIADATIERWLTPEFRTRNPCRWQQIRDSVLATSVAGYCGAVAALSDFDFAAELPHLRAATLVLYGEDDRATSHEENQRLSSLIPGGRFVQFAGARHLPNIEDPARFNSILTDWLRRS